MPPHTPINSNLPSESRGTLPAITRLLIPEALDADQNMAIDEVLLDGQGWALRITSWLSRAITIGRFQQRSDCDELKAQISGHRNNSSGDEGPTVIRRITGGGAILHGQDLTLALAGPCPSPVFPERSPASVADRCARSLVAALLPGCPELQCRGGEERQRRQLDLADCFLRSSPSDLVVNDNGQVRKIGGLALHFRRARVLIQISIDRGQISLGSGQEETFLDRWSDALEAPATERGELSSEEMSEAEHLRQVRYRSPGWNHSGVASP